MNEVKTDNTYAPHAATYQLAFFGFITLMLLVNALAPRFWGVGIPVFGLVFLIAYSPMVKSWLLIPKQFVFLSAIMIGLVCASSMWSLHPDEVWDRAASLAPILLGGAFFLSAALSLQMDEDKRIPIMLLIGFCVSLIVIGVNLFTQMSLHKLTHGIPLEETVLYFAMNRPICALTVLVWPILAIYQYHKGYKHGFWLAWLLLVICVFASESQSSQLALLCSFAAFFLYGLMGRIFIWIMFAVICLYSIIFPWVLPDLFYDHLSKMDFYNRTGATASDLGHPFQRLEIWTLISESIQKSPYIGHGAEATKDMVFPGEKIFLHNNSFLHPHNMTMQIWNEFGVCGIVVILTAVKVALTSIKFVPQHFQPHTVAGFVAFYSIANMSYGVWQSWFVGLMITSLVLYGCLVKFHVPDHKPEELHNL